MRCGIENADSRSFYEDYIRDLVLVARCGNRDTRQLFLQRYAEQLCGLANYLQFLTEREQDLVFADALRPREGSLPRSLAGTRLATPAWFNRRVSNPFNVWKAEASYCPERVEIDPMCRMIVDPLETPYVSRRNGVDVYFCCLTCLEQFERGGNVANLSLAS